VEMKATQNLEQAHAGNFIDAIFKTAKVNAGIEDGMAASVPVMMALQSYWTKKICTAEELA
jgi:hypothetical protein